MMTPEEREATDWGEADDASVFHIYLSEKDFTEFSDLALGDK